MKIFKKVTVVGTGLIGGSIALALKQRKLAEHVTGISRHEKTIKIAKKEGAIDSGSCDIRAAEGSDLVILATPVSVIMGSARSLRDAINKDCIVTDVGSTKKQIVSLLTHIFPRFVGSHPLAGSEKRGIVNADPDLFDHSLCILTPVQSTDPKALHILEDFWKKLGSHPLLMNPDTHDKMLGTISHLPHILAFSLMNTVPACYLRYAPNSLKDATRVAASDQQLWADIFWSNRTHILAAIRTFQKELKHIEQAIRKKDRNRLIRLLKQARKKRGQLS